MVQPALRGRREGGDAILTTPTITPHSMVRRKLVADNAIHNLSCCVCGAETGWVPWRDAVAVGWRWLITARSRYAVCGECSDSAAQAALAWTLSFPSPPKRIRTCTTCGRQIQDDAERWPDGDGYQYQDCWEDATGAAWHRVAGVIPAVEEGE